MLITQPALKEAIIDHCAAYHLHSVKPKVETREVTITDCLESARPFDIKHRELSVAKITQLKEEVPAIRVLDRMRAADEGARNGDEGPYDGDDFWQDGDQIAGTSDDEYDDDGWGEHEHEEHDGEDESGNDEGGGDEHSDAEDNDDDSAWRESGVLEYEARYL